MASWLCCPGPCSLQALAPLTLFQVLAHAELLPLHSLFLQSCPPHPLLVNFRSPCKCPLFREVFPDASTSVCPSLYSLPWGTSFSSFTGSLAVMTSAHRLVGV